MPSRAIDSRALATLAFASVLVLAIGESDRTRALARSVARPEAVVPVSGDPRLERIPDAPLHLADTLVYTTDQFGVEKRLMMRFPPRVNGQNESDGDKHADLYVFFDATTGRLINQPVVLEAAPKNAAGPELIVTDLQARMFSAIWEVHAVLVDSSYDPSNPAEVIDSAIKISTSGHVVQLIQTNMFLNCPVVPRGTTVDPGSSKPERAFFDGHLVTIVPYDIEDGEFNVQILFKFEDQQGYTLGRRPDGTPARSTVDSPDFIPHLVASHALGDPFYTSLWEVWTVTVPTGTDVSAIRSKVAINDATAAGTFTIRSAGFRLNCPVVSVDDVPVPIEDYKRLLMDDASRFAVSRFPFDVPAYSIFKSRTFQATEITRVLPVVDLHPERAFPMIDSTGTGFIGNINNVIPLILQDPFGPSNSEGAIIRIEQADLDAGFAQSPPRLPPAIEANFTKLIHAGLLGVEWWPGWGHTYQERLALVGKAVFKLLWTPEQGAHANDVTACRACHSHPSDGASSRGLYTLERAIAGRPEIGTQTNAGSLFGSGPAELLNNELRARGEPVTFAHGTQGSSATIRGFVSGANSAHFGIEAVEKIAAAAHVPINVARTTDADRDGVVNELSVGEVTAETAFMMTLPLPDQASNVVMAMLNIPRDSVQRGSKLFRKTVADGGVGCASCHRPFFPIAGTEVMLPNPETTALLPLQMPHHWATQADVDDGLAAYVGQPGLRVYGDYRKHDMGPKMLANGTTIMKTAELWDVGSDAPLLRNGSMGSDLRGAILAHGGEGLESELKFESLSPDQQQDIVNFLRVQLIDGKVGEGSGAQLPLPQPPTTTLTVSPGTINKGEYALVSWSTTGAQTVSIEPWGPVSTSGSFWISPALTTILTLSANATCLDPPSCPSGEPASQSVTLQVVQPAPIGPAPAGLVAAYSFNEPGGEVAIDGSGHGHDGVIAGARRTTAGFSGNALSFDGLNDWITVPDAAALRLTTAVTMEAWIAPSDLHGWQSVVLKESGGDLTYGLYASDTAARPAGYVRTSTDAGAHAASTLPLNTWTHLAATYDGARLKLYVNGELVKNSAVSGGLANGSGPLRIGGNAVWGEFFSGLIDEVRIYKRALSKAEIQWDMLTRVP